MKNEIGSFLPEAKMLKIDCASMIGRCLQQLIDHKFGWRVPTLLLISSKIDELVLKASDHR